MRRLVIILAAVVAGIVILLVVAASLLNVNRYRPRIQAEMQKKLGRSVTLGELHLHLLPFSIKIDGLTIGDSPAFSSSRPFATASEVYVSAGLMSLIRGAPEIKELTLNNPQIELIRNASGSWNFSDLGGGSKSTPQSDSNEGFSLNRVKITDGQVAVTDQKTKSPRSVYNHIDATADGIAPDKQFDLDAAAHLPGQGKEQVAFHGKAGPFVSSGGDTVPVAGQLTIQEVSLAGLNSVAGGSIPPNTDAVISGTANIAPANGAIQCKGGLTLRDAVVHGTKAPYPIETQFDLAMNQKTDQLAVASALLKTGSTAVSLSGTVDSGVRPPTLNVRLGTRNASIPELSRLAGLFGVAFDANDQVKGSLSADLSATGAATSPHVAGTISASSLQAQDIVLSNVHATCDMKDGVVQMSPVTAGVFGGQENGTITVDTKPAHPQCSVKAHLAGVDTNALLSAVSSMKGRLYGSLAADANLSFAVDASTNLARTLNGVLNFNVTNGELKNINLLGELSRIGNFLNKTAAAPNASGTPLKQFSGTLDVKDGVATTNNLTAVLPEGSLSGAGSLNLVNEGVDMRVNAVLSNTTSKTVGGTGVGGFLNTALANNKGELVMPVLITGSMAHPVVTPDAQSIAKMKVSRLLPTTADPSKLAGGLLGSVLGGAPGQQPNQKNKQQQAAESSGFDPEGARR